MSQRITAEVHKAGLTIQGRTVPDGEIFIRRPMGPDVLGVKATVYLTDAIAIERMLRDTLPEGTYERVLLLMLEWKALDLKLAIGRREDEGEPKQVEPKKD